MCFGIRLSLARPDVSNAAVGAGIAGLVGALVGAGIPEEEATFYNESVGRGGMLLTVHANSDAQLYDANEVMRRNSGTDVRTYGGATDAAHEGAPMTGVPGSTAAGNANTWDDASITDQPAATIDTRGSGMNAAAVGGAVGVPLFTGAHAAYRDEDREVGDVNANPRETPTGSYEGAEDQYDRAPESRDRTADEMAGDAAGGSIGTD